MPPPAAAHPQSRSPRRRSRKDRIPIASTTSAVTVAGGRGAGSGARRCWATRARRDRASLRGCCGRLPCTPRELGLQPVGRGRWAVGFALGNGFFDVVSASSRLVRYVKRGRDDAVLANSGTCRCHCGEARWQLRRERANWQCSNCGGTPGRGFQRAWSTWAEAGPRADAAGHSLSSPDARPGTRTRHFSACGSGRGGYRSGRRPSGGGGDGLIAAVVRWHDSRIP